MNINKELNNEVNIFVREMGEEGVNAIKNVMNFMYKLKKSQIYLSENERIELVINEAIKQSGEDGIKKMDVVMEKHTDKLINDKNLQNKLDIESSFGKLTVYVNEKLSKVEEPLKMMSNQIDTIKDTLNYNKNTVAVKGKISEKRLLKLLIEIFPSAEIEETAKKTAQGDFIIKRENKKDIMIETKDYSINVGKKEIEKFERDVKNGDRNGILLSQNTGIVKKENYDIEIIEKSIVMYVHKVNYEEEKIKLAVTVIDRLTEQFIELSNRERCSDTDIKINKKKLIEFKTELIRKEKEKVELIKLAKKNCNEIIKAIESFELPMFEIFEFERNEIESEEFIEGEVSEKYDVNECGKYVVKRVK
jgi:hypothetical protein